jgi:hypothetical protein
LCRDALFIGPDTMTSRRMGARQEDSLKFFGHFFGRKSRIVLEKIPLL